MRRSEDTVDGPRAFAETRTPTWTARRSGGHGGIGDVT